MENAKIILPYVLSPRILSVNLLNFLIHINVEDVISYGTKFMVIFPFQIIAAEKFASEAWTEQWTQQAKVARPEDRQLLL